MKKSTSKKNYGRCERFGCEAKATNKYIFDAGEIHFYCAEHSPKKLQKTNRYIGYS